MPVNRHSSGDSRKRCGKHRFSGSRHPKARIETPTARLLLSLLNRGGRVLAAKRGPFGESWVELTREHITETVAGQADYPLPEGFTLTSSPTRSGTARPTAKRRGRLLRSSGSACRAD